ncbi:MAG: hypothetical protein AAFP22_06995 [Planctomycetota bacterium]
MSGPHDERTRAALRAADVAGPPLRTAPPSVLDLERTHRRRTFCAGAAFAAAALLAWQSPRWLGAADHAPAETGAQSVAAAPATDAVRRASRSIEDTRRLARVALGLPECTVPRVSESVERALVQSFRALHRAAESGDVRALDDLAGLAVRYPNTGAGACARAYLAELAGSVSTDAEEAPR